MESVGRSILSLADGPFGSNLASKHYTDEGARVIRLGNIGVGRFKDDDRAYISLERYTVLKRHAVEAGDVIVAGLGDSNNPLGRACRVPAGLGRAIVKADCFRLRMDETRLDSRFLVYFLTSSLGEWGAKVKSRGSTRQRMNPRDVASLHLPAPPLREQRRIADFLDVETSKIDQMMQLRREMSLLLQQRERALLDVEIATLVCRFGSLPFRRFILRMEQGVSPQCDVVPASDQEWGVLKVSAVKNGQFFGDQNKRLPDELLPESQYEVRAGDLLITRANTPALVGAAAVARNPRRRLILCDKIFRVHVSDGMSKDYLALIARGTRIRDLCAEASHGSSQSMANLKTEEIKQWPIPKAPLAEQEALTRRFDVSFSISSGLIGSIKTQVRLLEERRRAVITAAVTGELDVTTARSISSV
ncbi:restriction endonuclease subunit S [Actinomadura sp. WMMA1423]|uniref:restriction endonuclease subunit S n=1 Tax=Actinomadura sp. WMMA1423 TaxID=2591108 RepID=UPI00143D25E7|nr:restriction endonuclease subunit S [Actinomadura sp. WMMA1423]